MADPVLTVAELLRPTFTQIADGVDSDPVVRRSDRADAQVKQGIALELKDFRVSRVPDCSRLFPTLLWSGFGQI